MSKMNESLGKLTAEGQKLVDFVSSHRTVIIIVVACGAIIAAVFQAQSYLNPERNEEKYTELSSSITVKSLDEEILEKLEATQNDQNYNVDSNFVPDRTNPFTE